MGKYDDAMYWYLSDNDRFADLFNAVFFGGEQALEGRLLESDSERCIDAANIEGKVRQMQKKPQDVHGVQRGFRDIKKRLKTGEGFVLLAVENQNDVDYTMPWRIMRYDQMEYGRQIEEITRKRRGERLNSGLPQSGWAERAGKENRLHPVYTICFYHGIQPWDGPKSLKDMMEFPENPLWRQCFQDYGMALFCANEAENLSKFRTGLGHLLKALPLRQDKQALSELWNQKEFECLDRETLETMAVLTDSTEILDKLDKYEEGGGYNMCLAVEEMKRDWKAEGIAEGMERGMAEGIVEMGLDCGLSENDILNKLQKKLNLSPKKAKEYFSVFGGQTV